MFVIGEQWSINPETHKLLKKESTVENSLPPLREDANNLEVIIYNVRRTFIDPSKRILIWNSFVFLAASVGIVMIR
jgi:hypothetical protein